MNINKHTLWHNIRTFSTGFFIIGLIPFPFVFMGPSNSSNTNIYFSYLFISLAGIIVAQLMVVKYKAYEETTDKRKKQQTLYGIIGVSLILLFVLSVALLPVLSKILQ